MNLLNVGGSLTGGSTVVLTEVSASSGKVRFAFPDNTRLAVRTLEVSASSSAKGSNPTGHTGVKLSFGDRMVEEGCCTVKTGTHFVDIGVRTALDQPEALVDDIIEAARAYVCSTHFESVVKTGVIARD